MYCIDEIVCISDTLLGILLISFLGFIMTILGIAYRLHRFRILINDSNVEFSISTWQRWRRWTAQRMYRQLNSALLVGKISSHTFLIKSLVAFGLIVGLVIAIRQSSPSSSPTGLDQQILVAATVFYATMIYFEGRFEYAALRPENVDVTLYNNNGAMPTVNTSLTLFNNGEITATDITAQMKIIDPVRNTSTFTHDAYAHPVANKDTKVGDPLESGRRREINFLFDSLENEFERTRMGDKYGIDPWIQIEIDSPDQRTSTWVYRSLKNTDPVDVNNIVKNTKATADLYRMQRDRVLSEKNTGTVGSEADKDDNEDIPPRGIR